MADLIRGGAHSPEIRRLATGIVNGVKEKDRAAEAAALCRWVQERIRYTRDPVDLELLTPPARLLSIGHGDCDDMSILLASMLRAIGIRARLRLLSSKESGSYQHVYVEALTGRGWMALDPTRKDRPPGWFPLGAVRRAAAEI